MWKTGDREKLLLGAEALAYKCYLEPSWRKNARTAEKHPLPARLVVSLTSYTPRFKTLGMTLKSLLAQSVKADAVILWIAQEELGQLPGDVVALQGDGLTVKTCADLRSYKKIIPLLQNDNQCFVVTADDDICYHRNWLRGLIQEYVPGRKEVICARAHRIRLGQDGLPLPYNQWEYQVPAKGPSTHLFPTGVAGVLYSPGIFYPDVTRVDLFRELCPTNDDIWLYWMANLNGAVCRKVGPRNHPPVWLSSQNITLAEINVHQCGNDIQIKRMIAHYGFQSSADSHAYQRSAKTGT
jgi:hypothetical protein